MPGHPARTCTHVGCNALSRDGTGRCSAHPREQWGKKPDAPQKTTDRGYGWSWQKLRADILRRDEYLCVTCRSTGKLVPADDVDHIKRKEDGGSDEPMNLQSLCRPCHKQKTEAEKRPA